MFDQVIGPILQFIIWKFIVLTTGTHSAPHSTSNAAAVIFRDPELLSDFSEARKGNYRNWNCRLRISPSTGDPQESEMDTVMVLTSSAYYVADYDETSDRLLAVQRVPLADLTSIEQGTYDANTTVIHVISHEGRREWRVMVRQTGLNCWYILTVEIWHRERVILRNIIRILRTGWKIKLYHA